MIMNNFSTNLKKLRIEKNIKQTDISKILNISQGAYAKYESGQREPSFETLIKISKLFNVTIDDLLNSSIDIYFNKIAEAKVNYTVNADIETKYDLISILNRKKNYYLNEKKKLEIILNKHIPERLNEINTFLKILEKNGYSLDCKEEFSSEITPDIDILKKRYTNLTSKLIKTRPIPYVNIGDTDNPNYDFEKVIDTFNVSEDKLDPSKDYFIFKIHSDTMDHLFKVGELILVEKTSIVENNDLVIALIGDEIIFNKISFKDNCIILLPLSYNPSHTSQTHNIPDVNIIGKVLGAFSEYTTY